MAPGYSQHTIIKLLTNLKQPLPPTTSPIRTGQALRVIRVLLVASRLGGAASWSGPGETLRRQTFVRFDEGGRVESEEWRLRKVANLHRTVPSASRTRRPEERGEGEGREQDEPEEEGEGAGEEKWWEGILYKQSCCWSS
jgi:hypothetical protein